VGRTTASAHPYVHRGCCCVDIVMLINDEGDCWIEPTPESFREGLSSPFRIARINRSGAGRSSVRIWSESEEGPQLQQQMPTRKVWTRQWLNEGQREISFPFDSPRRAPAVPHSSFEIDIVQQKGSGFTQDRSSTMTNSSVDPTTTMIYCAAPCSYRITRINSSK
jgi:hypothetical protein